MALRRRVKVERVVLNALAKRMGLCRLMYAPSAIPASSEKPIHLQATRLPLQKTGC